MDHAYANELQMIDGVLTGKLYGDIINAEKKANIIKTLTDQYGFKSDEVISIGDGANDLLMMKEAGLSVAYHAKPAVQEQATTSLNHAGLDAILDFIDQ